ncbi:MAG: dihydropteroate synthase [Hydrogenophilales bacterium 32-62-9]|nr:MAG: dihydropteroate synthase [Hydrogenophilales bacterium 32-62-9]
MSVLHAGPHRLSLLKPLIMGIVNTTPDSFSDGGRWLDAQSAIRHALQLQEEGADILDVGGESTRPGAATVSAEEETRRVLPVISELVRQGCVVSVDTKKPEVMRAALDVALETVAASAAAVCLMHMQGDPQTMQRVPSYVNVVEEVQFFLQERVRICEASGILRERLLIDPGFGFGKTLQHNLELLKHLDRLQVLGIPVLAGLSRKSFLGQLTGREPGQREFAGVAAHLIAVAQGARVLRVHQVSAMRDALVIWNAVEET